MSELTIESIPADERSCDTAVIGGGMIGCSIAWRLAQAGMRVFVFDRGDVSREASWAAGGILAPMAEADQADEFYHLAASSRAMYPAFARELAEASGVDIAYRTEGLLHLALQPEDETELEHRWAWQHAAGLNVKRLNRDCVLKLEPSLNPQLKWALKFPDDHQVDTRLLVKALETAARNAGVRFFPQTEVKGFCFEGSEVRGVRTSRGEIKARAVVVAAGSWSTRGPLAENRPTPGFQIEPIHGQMIAIEMPEPSIGHVIFSPRAYLVPRSSGFVIAGSTMERIGFEKRVTAGGVAAITANAIEISPALSDRPILECWAGLRPALTPDASHAQWPVLGEDAHCKGLVYATGHFRNGVLLTPITARAITDLLLRGESSIDLAPFSPQRFDPLPPPMTGDHRTNPNNAE